jgi:methylmalonyl-CoA mutase cobalamin-binding domain/chain
LNRIQSSDFLGLGISVRHGSETTMTTSPALSKITDALADLEEDKLLSLIKERLDAGDDPLVLVEACRKGMTIVGERFEKMEYFLTHLAMSAEMFSNALKLIEPKIKAAGSKITSLGKIVFGTVKGDVHDIGKNMVETMLRCAGFDVIDMGVDVPAEKFVQALKDSNAEILGLSALITTSFDSMKETVDAVKKAGLRNKVKILVGGGIVDEKVVKYTGADGYAVDAMSAVKLVESIMAKQKRVKPSR